MLWSFNKRKIYLICVFIFAVSLIVGILFYKKFMKMVYPIKYGEIVYRACDKYNIDPELVYAVIKNESNFDENAKSGAGACGLMQITRDTFDWLLMYTGDDLSEDDLINPEVNINYGTMMISMLKNKYFSEEVALCAYNAGISTVDRWLKNENYTENGEELYFVPYKETRDYVNRVMETKFIYKNLYFRDNKN